MSLQAIYTGQLGYTLSNSTQPFISQWTLSSGCGGVHVNSDRIITIPKSPAYVVGEQILASLVKICSKFFEEFSHLTFSTASVPGRIYSYLPTITLLPGVAAEEVQATSCYQKILSKHPNLTPSVKQVVETICENTLTSFEIDSMTINDDAAKAIGEALSQNTRLNSLKIRWSSKTFGSISEISSFLSGLRRNTSLKTLEFSGGEMNSASIDTLFSNLPCLNLNSIRMSLSMFSKITVPDVQVLVNKLKKGPFPLKAIIFDYDHLESSHLKVLAEALKTNTCLTNVSFPDNESDSDLAQGVEAIFKAAEEGKTLASFGITVSQSLGSINSTLIINSIRTNKCFIQFNFEDTNIPQELLNKMAAIMRGRKPCTPDPKCEATVLDTCFLPATPFYPRSSNNL